MSKFPWEVAGVVALVAVAVLGFAGLAVFEHRRANAWELKFRQERHARQILARCHMWAVEGYVIANPDDCITFDPVAWRNRPIRGLK